MSVRKLLFANANGQAIEIGAGTDYSIDALEGIDPPDLTVQVQAGPGQDGETYLGGQYGPRTVSVSGGITIGPNLAAIGLRRLELTKALAGKGVGTLTLTLDHGTWTTPAVALGAPAFSNRPSRDPFQRFMVEFYCPDPHWYEVDDQQAILSFAVGSALVFDTTMEFPDGGITLGDAFAEASGGLDNSGQVDTPIQATISGPVTDPILENQTTGETLAFSMDLGSDQTLVITSAFGNKTATILEGGVPVGSAMQYLDAGSVFWMLRTGVNIVTFRGTGGAPQVVINWTNRLLGV